MQEPFDAFVRRKSQQADAQDDVQRGAFVPRQEGMCLGCYRHGCESEACKVEHHRSTLAQHAMKQGWPKRFGHLCPWCGQFHATMKEVNECREIG